MYTKIIIKKKEDDKINVYFENFVMQVLTFELMIR